MAKTVDPPANRGKPYRDGELEVILSVVPTTDNICWLATLLEREERAIEVVYRIAYGYGAFGKSAGIQRQRIMAAKKRVGIGVGPRH